jgi:hypothetical protein
MKCLNNFISGELLVPIPAVYPITHAKDPKRKEFAVSGPERSILDSVLDN